jgi:hypothetical protein
LLRRQAQSAVRDEEQRGGMFAEAKQSDLDLIALGEQLAIRKQVLMANEA